MKNFTMLQLDHVIFSHQTEVHRVLSSNRSKVAKYSSSDFLSQKRMPTAHFGLQPEASFEHTPARPKSAPAPPSRVKRVTTPTVVPKSVSIAQLLRAGTLVKPLKTTTLQLEHFDAEKNKWVPACSINLQIEEEPFSSGAFRDDFKATCSHAGLSGEWVVKKYQPTSVKTIVDILKSTAEDHTRKQVQMHAVARNITQRVSSRVPTPFGDTFSYGKVFYSVLDELPETVEEFVPGEFQKYVNNDGTCYAPVMEDHQEVNAKAECLVHFSDTFSEKKMMLVFKGQCL